MRATLTLTLAALALAGCSHARPTDDPGPPDAHPQGALFVVAEGGVIRTQDPAKPAVEALFVDGGKILATGSAEQLEAAHPEAERHRLGPVTVLPGIIDAHVHVRELGLDALRVNLEGCLDMDCMLARLQAAVPRPETGVWIVGQGWDEGAWASRGYPDRAALDAAFPHTPLALFSLHGFAGLFNGVALEAGGVRLDDPQGDQADPEGGTILRDDDGRATGVLLAGAQDMVRATIPPPSAATREAAIRRGLELLAAAGVTCIHEAGMTPADLSAFLALAQREHLPIRVYGMLDGNDDELVAAALERGPVLDPDDRLSLRAFKVFYDGSLGSRTALLAAPYADAPAAARPAERIAPAKIEALARAALDRGFQLAVHTIGDAANAKVLDIFEAALGEHPRVDHRWRLEHAQIMAEGDFQRAARLGVVVSMQPSHAVGDSPWAEDRLGPQRVTRAYAWRRFLAAGVPLVLNSDLPGEPWTPMQTLYFAVTRQPLDGSAPPWFPEQALSVDEALTAMTATAAYAGFAEGRLGVLAPGAWADFVVLEADPLRVEASGLAEIGVRETWVAGAQVRVEGGSASGTAGP